MQNFSPPVLAKKGEEGEEGGSIEIEGRRREHALSAISAISVHQKRRTNILPNHSTLPEEEENKGRGKRGEESDKRRGESFSY